MSFCSSFAMRHLRWGALPMCRQHLLWTTISPFHSRPSSVQRNLLRAARLYSSAVDVQKWMQENDITCSGTDPPAPLLSFEDGNWPTWIQRAINAQGFKSPTLIQSISWGVALQGRDMIGIAATGSGKTLGFTLPCLMTALKNPRQKGELGPSSLIVCPTRELAQQTFDTIFSLTRRTTIRSACLYGGKAKNYQLDVLDRGVDVIVCTPGRMIDLLKAGATTLDRVSFLVLDEADRMLDMGFEEQIRMILEGCPQKKQTLMWSATWPKEVQGLAAEFLDDPVHITVGSLDLAANKDIRQHVVICKPLEKPQKLLSLLQEQLEGKKVLIFAATKSTVDVLEKRLGREGVHIYSIHGDKTQINRDNTIAAFRQYKDVVLVATDVAARGLDVRDVDVVINYDFPKQIQDYIHRIGRTARAGAKGEAYSLFTSEDARMAKELVEVMEKAGQPVEDDLRALAAPKFSPPVLDRVLRQRPRMHPPSGSFYNRPFLNGPKSGRSPGRRSSENYRSDYTRSHLHRKPAHKQAPRRYENEEDPL